MVIESSEAFSNASECLSSVADTRSRRREMYRIKDCRMKRVLQVDELEHLNQRLKILEEDTESVKQAILWHVKEKRGLVNRIYHYFQRMQYMLSHRRGVKGEQVCREKLIMKTPKDGGAVTGLPEVLCHNLNPSLITKGFQAAIYFSKKL
ncbi:uncharacterized protein LOC114751420 [Neltuma alba]|uniref:uncharacterized protein LOC114751420 n=1 Tax=Neltuma alba TaxID=207710 RepID=UPI0010A55809|nr:uncharacterized protein LOC114751420 [Prosopis alba]